MISKLYITISNLSLSALFHGPQQLMFYYIFKKKLRKFGVCVVLCDPIFLEKKTTKNSIKLKTKTI